MNKTLIISFIVFISFVLSAQTVSAGWTSSHVFSGGSFFDDVLGIDPDEDEVVIPTYTPTPTPTPKPVPVPTHTHYNYNYDYNHNYNYRNTNYYYDDLSVSCYASPSDPEVGERVNWYVDVEGGDGDYDYEWSGTNSLDSSSRSPSKTYSSAGRKSATVTVRDHDGNRDSDTCYITVDDSDSLYGYTRTTNTPSVLSYSQTYQPAAASAIYLNQVPYTGVADNLKLYFFIGILTFFSAWVAYIVISYQKSVGELN